MRSCFLILALGLFSCNSNQQQSKQQEQLNLTDNCFVYPKTIDSLQIRDLYDSARWYVYTWECDQNYLPRRDSLKSITFGELPLKFNNLNLKGDTIELNFDFIDEDEPHPILPSMTRDNKELVTGVGFDMKTKRKVHMLFPGGTIKIKGGANRYENPLQPEVIGYVKSNWNKINGCFKKLAEQKGIKK